jgi:sulfur-carrier protein
MIRVVLPHHLRTLARVGDEVTIEPAGTPSVRSVLDALEASYPMLRGTIREHSTLKRRPMVRFFACGEDVSLAPPEDVLPGDIVTGKEPLFIVGAIAGG